MASVDLETLLLSGPRTARELALALGVSQPTVSRRLAEQGERVLAIGQARARRYAWRRPVRDIGWEWPVYRVDAVGGTVLAGRLSAIHPAGYVWRDERSHQESVFDGLPWFLADNRPQGFIGRSQYSDYFAELYLPARVHDWTDNDVLVFLVAFSQFSQGDFLIGDAALHQYLQLFNGLKMDFERMPSDDWRNGRDDYTQHVIDVFDGQGVNASSAAGEQPKFGCWGRRRDELKEFLVKFSPLLNSEAGQRWGDLLCAEHLALCTLCRAGVDVAESELVLKNQRVFLELVRFDRPGSLGRTGVVSFEAVSGEFSGRSGGWDEQAAALLEQGLIPQQDYDHILRIHAFGNLIANTDMHPGNLSFFLGDDFSLRLAPVYDMLPMHHAPNTHGEVIARPIRQARPTRLTEPVWEEVKAWATDYWQRVAGDDRVSADFRAIAAQYHRALSA